MASILGRLRDRFAGSDEVDPVVAALRDALADDRVKIDGAQRALLSYLYGLKTSSREKF